MTTGADIDGGGGTLEGGSGRPHLNNAFPSNALAGRSPMVSQDRHGARAGRF